MEPDHSQQRRVCRICNALIPEELFIIHSNCCQVNQAVRNKQKNQAGKKKTSKARQKKERQPQKKEEIKPPPQSSQNKEQEEKFPCYLCGYQQSLSQLDTHFKNCRNRQISCSFCQSSFPANLITDHRIVCSGRPSRPLPVRHGPSPIRVVPASNPANISLNRSSSVNNTSSPPLFIRPVPANSTFVTLNRRIPLPPRMASQSTISQFNSSSGMSRDVNRQQPQQRTQSQSSIGSTSSSAPSINLLSRPGPRPPEIYESFQDSQNQESERPNPVFRGTENSNLYMQLIRQRYARTELMRLNEAMTQHIRTVAARFDQKNNGGLKQHHIFLIPNKTYKRKSQSQAQTCSICFCDFQEEEQIKDLKCKHLFHVKCISQWLLRNKLCPMCKSDTTSSIVLRRQLQTKSAQEKEKPQPKVESGPNVEPLSHQRRTNITEFVNSRLEEYMMSRWFYSMENDEQQEEEGSTANFGIFSRQQHN